MYVRIGLTYVRHYFRSIHEFCTKHTWAEFLGWFTYGRWTVMYVRSCLKCPEAIFDPDNVREMFGNVREGPLTYVRFRFTYVRPYFLYIIRTPFISVIFVKKTHSKRSQLSGSLCHCLPNIPKHGLEVRSCFYSLPFLHFMHLISEFHLGRIFRVLSVSALCFWGDHSLVNRAQEYCSASKWVW